VDRASRARRAGLYRGRPLENDGQAHPHPAAHRRALPRANGAAPRGRVLFALISAHGALEIAAVLIGGRPWALRAQPPSSIRLGGSGKPRVRSTRFPCPARPCPSAGPAVRPPETFRG